MTAICENCSDPAEELITIVIEGEIVTDVCEKCWDENQIELYGKEVSFS